MTVLSLLVTALLCVCVLGSRAQGPLHQDEARDLNRCPSLSDADRARIIVYLSKWLEVENLSIESDEIIPGTCYRKLGIKGALHPMFFLSADQRFLSGSLLDTAVDPEQQRRIAHEEANRILLANRLRAGEHPVLPSQSSNSVISSARIAKNSMNFLPHRSESALFSSIYQSKATRGRTIRRRSQFAPTHSQAAPSGSCMTSFSRTKRP